MNNRFFGVQVCRLFKMAPFRYMEESGLEFEDIDFMKRSLLYALPNVTKGQIWDFTTGVGTNFYVEGVANIEFQTDKVNTELCSDVSCKIEEFINNADYGWLEALNVSIFQGRYEKLLKISIKTSGRKRRKCRSCEMGINLGPQKVRSDGPKLYDKLRYELFKRFTKIQSEQIRRRHPSEKSIAEKIYENFEVLLG